MNDNLIETILNKDLVDWTDKAFIIWYHVHTGVEDINGNIYNETSEEYLNHIDNEGKFKLEPGESMYLVMQSRWPDVTEFSENNVKYVATNSFTIDWEQYTN